MGYHLNIEATIISNDDSMSKQYVQTIPEIENQKTFQNLEIGLRKQ